MLELGYRADDIDVLLMSLELFLVRERQREPFLFSGDLDQALQLCLEAQTYIQSVVQDHRKMHMYEVK